MLLDFNPFGSVTDSLLFDWNEFEEIKNVSDQEVLFRFVEDDLGVHSNQYSMYQLPTDMIDILHEGNTDKLVDLLKMVNLYV